MVKINCRLNLKKEFDDNFIVLNNWHNRPLIKNKYKFKENNFKNHIRVNNVVKNKDREGLSCLKGMN